MLKSNIKNQITFTNTHFTLTGFTINRICWLSTKILSTRIAVTASKGISTAIGLAAIPFIIRPIDHGVDSLMENTFRSWFVLEKALQEKKLIHHNRDD